MVCVSPNPGERIKMLSAVAVQCGFAFIPSEGRKLIANSIDDIDIPSAYFVLADNYDFKVSDATNQRLFEMAARGIAIIVAVRKLPSVYEAFCTVYYPESIL